MKGRQQNMADYYGAQDYTNKYAANGLGIYTAGTQFDFDSLKLKSLGFLDVEIQCMQQVLCTFGKVTMQSLQMAGCNYAQAQRIKYMYDICTGKIQVDSEDQLIRHLRKMFGSKKRIGIGDLPVSNIQVIPRTALIGGITDPTWQIYNSKNYLPLERQYRVIQVTSNNILVETTRKPVLRYKQEPKLDGVCEIKEMKQNGKIVLAVNKDYCRLCNHYIIVASLKKPEYHLGLVQIICIEGTKVYVFAQDIGTKERSHYNSQSQRVYDYGYFKFNIDAKLKAVASVIYKKVCGVQANLIAGNSDFEMLSRETAEADEVSSGVKVE